MPENNEKKLPETLEELRAALEQTRKAQAGSDKNYLLEKTRADALQAKLDQLGGDAVLQRVKKIEAAFAEKTRRFELDIYARRKALELGLPSELLSGRDFTDEAQIETFLGVMEKTVESKALAEVDRRLVSTEKPKAAATAPARVQSVADSFKNLGRN